MKPKHLTGVAAAASTTLAVLGGVLMAAPASATGRVPLDGASTTTTTGTGGATAGAGSTTTTGTTVAGSTTTTGTTVPTTTTRPTSTTTAAPSADQLLGTAIALTAAQHAVHWTYRINVLGQVVTQSVDAGRTDGTENEAYHLGGSVARLQVLLAGNVYLKGNVKGLELAAGFTNVAAKAEHEKWIRVGRKNANYAALSFRLTVASVAQSLDIGTAPKIVPALPVKGQPAIGVQQKLTTKGITLSQTIYVPAKGQPLPLGLDESFQGLNGHETFGPWGKAPDVKVPKHSTAIKQKWLTAG